MQAMSKQKREGSVTVIVPFYNEEDLIEKKFLNCVELVMPKTGMIIFVNDFSIDESPNIIRKLAQSINPDKLLVVDNKYFKGKIGAIKTGYEIANTEYVVTTDTDVLVNDNAILELSSVLDANSNIGLTFGEVEQYRTLHQCLMHVCMRSLSLIDSAVTVTGQLFMFRKNIEIEFDEKMIADDGDIPIQIRKKGYLCKQVPSAIFVEKRQEDNEVISSKRRTLGLYQVLNKHMDVCFNINYGWYGIICYPICVCYVPALSVLFLSICVFFVLSLASIHFSLGFIGLISMFGFGGFRKKIFLSSHALYTLIYYSVTKNADCAWR